MEMRRLSCLYFGACSKKSPDRHLGSFECVQTRGGCSVAAVVAAAAAEAAVVSVAFRAVAAVAAGVAETAVAAAGVVQRS